MHDPYLTITPLGGLGEIGLNCQLWETPGGVVMVDCGLMFPDDAPLGVDVVIPHFGAVSAIKDKLLGIVLTHGHEDHIGALPWLVPELKGTRIYGSPFTLALVEHKLREREILDWVELCPVNAKTVLPLGDLTFHFFPVCHSIPEGFGLGVETPVGRVVHSGDFKIDPPPLSGSGTDLRLFRNFAGPKGARLLLSDSTNAMREGRSLTEREVKDSLDNIFATAKGRIVITLFSSHIQRIQEVFDLARAHGRTVVISGKSLANNIEMARDLGIAKLPPAFFNAHNGVPDLRTQITGGHRRARPLSASPAWSGRPPPLDIPTDTVHSSRIPGNPGHLHLLNEFPLGLISTKRARHPRLRARPARRTPNVRPVHRSSSPIHGEYQHLVKHGRLAAECGVQQENVVLLEDGQPITLRPEGFQLENRVPVECTLVDGKGVGDVGYAVLKERRILGDEGMVIVVLVVDSETGSILHGPEMISKGFVFEQHYSHLLEDAKCLVLDEIEAARPGQLSRLQENIRSSLRRFFRRVLERDPIVVPVISEV
jgi:ribonuclease J